MPKDNSPSAIVAEIIYLRLALHWRLSFANCYPRTMSEEPAEYQKAYAPPEQRSSMKFTLALADLENLLKAVVSRPRKDDTVIVSACVARVFIECKGNVAGIEALVFGDGAVTLPAQKFRDLLKTYKGTRFLTFEWGVDGLYVQNFRMPVLAYDPRPKPPADFQVFPVTHPPSSTTTESNPSRIQV